MAVVGENTGGGVAPVVRARLFVYIKNMVPRGTHSRWNQKATDLPEKEAN